MTDYILATFEQFTGGQFLLLTLLVCLLYAALNDLRYFIIPNSAVLLITVAAVFWAPFQGMGLGAHLAGAAFVLAAGFIAYFYGIFGAGDAKLMAAVTLFVGPNQAVDVAFQTAIFGGILTFLWIGSRPVRLMLSGMGFEVDLSPPNRIPYGIAIAAAGVAFLGRHWGIVT